MNYSDQINIFDPKRWGYPIHLIGAGGINNLVGLVLAKMGITELHLWDDDLLEERNCPTEITYSYRMIGQPKIDAMTDIIHYLMPQDSVNIVRHYERVTATTALEPGVVICGVDSMQSRKEIWENVKNHYLDIPLFIDGRSAGTETAIFALSPVDADDRTDYQTWLFDDSQTMQLPCGARNIGYVSTYMATETARIITLYQQQAPIPFYTSRNFANF